MVNCANCGKKLGLFHAKHNYEDEKGNPIKYCSECNRTFEEKEEEERIAKINEFLDKYFSECDVMKKVAIGRFYSEEDISNQITNDSLDAVRNHIIQLAANSEYVYKQNKDIDRYLHMKKIFEYSLEYIEDLEKMLKILHKKNIESDYLEITELLHEHLEKTISEENEAAIKPEYKRISNILKKDIDVESVIKEFMKSPIHHDISENIISMLLDKFDLEYDEYELPELIEKVKEEVDLENFENNFGKSKNVITLPDYESLSGHQFEAFLKKLFENLEYVVVQTKVSGDQGADLVMMKNGVKTVVQAKKYAGAVSNKAIQEVVAAKRFYKSENALVVTTGEFTKSAIQLALSNDVEVWDKNKLDSVISSINKSEITKIKTSQDVNLSEDIFPINCPFCHSDFNVNVEELPDRDEDTNINCSECGVSLKMTIPEKFYTCSGCNNEFDSVSERMKHAKNCKILKERQFSCQSCKKIFTLDDEEMSELKKNKDFRVKCPICNKFTHCKKE